MHTHRRRHNQGWHPGRFALIALGLCIGCTRPNPAYLGPYDGAGNNGDGSAAPDVPADMPSDTKPDVTADVPADRAPDTGTTDTKTDIKTDVKADATDAGFTCVTAAECTARLGSAPCGAWACRAGACVLNCPNCTDLDGDGYGVGTGCAGLDCDDADPTVLNTVLSRSCTAGAPIAPSMGPICRAGTQSCTAGVWSACSGQVVPSDEACNGEDDDCNGTADDNLATPKFTCGLGACQKSVLSCRTGILGVCVPLPSTAAVDDCTNMGVDDDCDGQVDEDCPAMITNCIHVSPDGDDGGDGTVDAPYQTIERGIAATNEPGAPSMTVCVAGGATCQDQATYIVGDGSTTPRTLFQMANGVSVYGSYRSSDWTRCQLDPEAPEPTVTIELHEGGGVHFSNAINLATTLDGFVLTRKPSGSVPSTIAAVTVNGAKNVQLSNLVINDAPSADQTFGVDLLGGQALITHCLIYGGAGTTASYGVRSVGSAPAIRDNCTTFDATGRCTTDCSQPLTLGIGGRVSPATMGVSAAVLLNASVGASIETSTICGAQGAQAIGVRIVGEATGTVIRGSSISASAGAGNSLGILAEDCNGAKPWIVGNTLIQGQGAGRVAGVLARGSCAPVIDGNALIASGGDTNTAEADGVACEPNGANQTSLCVVLGNKKIQGATSGRPLVGAGVACKGAACVRVADNIVAGGTASDVRGVWLQKDGAMVERNRITGGCGGQVAVGLLADDSFARIQNNLITAGSCVNNTLLSASPTNIGLRVFGANTPNEIDIESNTIDGGGNAGLAACTSTAIELGTGTNPDPTAPKGIVRNNILSGGACSMALTAGVPARTDFSEARTTTDPRLFQNNDLNPSGTPGTTTLYLDEGTTARTSAMMINNLPDIVVTSGNIILNPMFVSPAGDLSTANLHLGANSPCIGAGTSTGAPTADFDGKPRGKPPSIGAYE